MQSNSVRFFLVILSLVSFTSAKAETPKTKKSVTVGLVFDYSGRTRDPVNVTEGVELARDELAKEGIELKLAKYNSNTTKLGTRNAMLELLKDPPDFIIAEVNSSKAIIAAEMAEESKRFLITPYATSPSVTKNKKYVFRACFTDAVQGPKLAQFAKKHLEAKSAAVFWNGSDLYSKGLAESFTKEFTRIGGKIKRNEAFLSSVKSFGPQIKSAVDLKVDVVFLPTYEKTAARFINESVLRGVRDLTFLGGDGWGGTRAFKDLVFSENLPVKGYWVSHYSGDFEDPSLKKMADTFTKKTGQKFNSSTAIGYDTAMLISEVVKAAPQNATQENYVQIMHRLKPYRGLTGTIHYENRQDPKKSIFVRRVDKKKMGFEVELLP